MPAIPISWLGSSGGTREPSGLIVVWRMCCTVQYMLDAAASMASSATFQGFCCGQHLAAVIKTVVPTRRIHRRCTSDHAASPCFQRPWRSIS